MRDYHNHRFGASCGPGGARRLERSDSRGRRRQVEYFKIPSEFDPATLPRSNGSSGEVLFTSFFDYNSAYCRKGAHDVREISDADSGVRLGLINNAILSIGSVQAAKVQRGILRTSGLQALAFHERMSSKRVKSDGASALAVAREMGLGVGLLGWPGRKAVESLISNTKLCDNPVCPPKP